MSRRYGLASYLIGSAAARTADEMSAPALLLVGMAAAVPASLPPLLVACLTASAAAGGPVLGALLDRAAHPGRFIALCLVAYAAGVALTAAALGALPAGLITVTALVTGLAGPAISGGWTSQLPSLIRAPALPRAQGLDATTYSLAGLIGPGLAGLCAVTVGARAGVAVAVVLLVPAALLARLMPHRAPDARPARAVPSLAPQIRSGIAAIVRIGPLRRATLASCIAFVAIGAFDVTAPRIGAQTLGGTGQGALLLSVTAAGAGVATLALARRAPALSHDTMLAAGLVVTATGFALVAIPSAAAVVIGSAVIGIGDGPALVALIGIRHRDAPPPLRAQVFTTGASLKITAASAGAALSGLLVAQPLELLLLGGASAHLLAAGVQWRPPRQCARHDRPIDPGAEWVAQAADAEPDHRSR